MRMIVAVVLIALVQGLAMKHGRQPATGGAALAR